MLRVEKKSIIEEILSIIYVVKINIIISINTKMSIKILTPNNRIIIKESFAPQALTAVCLTTLIYFNADDP